MSEEEFNKMQTSINIPSLGKFYAKHSRAQFLIKSLKKMQRKLFKIQKVTPPFTRMLVTANTYTEEDCISDNGLVMKDQVGMLKDIQEVVSVGSGVRDYTPGDLVCIDFQSILNVDLLRMRLNLICLMSITIR